MSDAEKVRLIREAIWDTNIPLPNAMVLVALIVGPYDSDAIPLSPQNSP